MPEPVSERRMVCITGGTGFRHVARALTRLNREVTYVINVSDSGGSSRELRTFFDIPAIGDIRSRLIDIADRTQPASEAITNLLSHRLGKNPDLPDPEKEFAQILGLEHPLVKKIMAAKPKRGFLDITMSFLEYFNASRIHRPSQGDKQFDLNNGSIGNFFLTNAYHTFHSSLEAAILELGRMICAQGDVIPATLENVHLGAYLENGTRIVGQHLITKKDTRSPIDRLFYQDRENMITGREIKPIANEAAVEAIREASLIVFSMGSFYTSILSTLHLLGIAEAVRESQARKVFIANTKEDAETWGMTAGTMAAKLIATLQKMDPQPSKNIRDYLDTIIVGGPQKIKENTNPMSMDTSNLKSIQVLFMRLSEDGYYDPNVMANGLNELLYIDKRPS